VAAVTFVGETGLLVSGSDDSRTRLWDVGDVSQPRLVSTVADHASWVRSAAIAPGGRLLATGGADHAVVLRDLERPVTTVRLARYECGSRIWATAFSPLGGQLAVAASRSLELWQVDGARRTAVTALTGHRDQIGAVAYSPDGATVASGGADGIVGLWDARPAGSKASNSRPPWRTLPHLAPVWAVAFGAESAAGPVAAAAAPVAPAAMLLATGSDDGAVRVWRVRSPTHDRPAGESELVSRLVGHAGKVRTVTFASAGKTLATGGDDATVRLWDVTSTDRPRCGQILARQGGRVLAVAFAPDGDSLAIAGGDGKVRLYAR
jgi:WD40 repeat protein